MDDETIEVKLNLKKIFLLFFFLFPYVFPTSIYDDNIKIGGLLLNGNFNKDGKKDYKNFSSLNITAKKEIEVNLNFSFSFYISFPESNSYGHIFILKDYKNNFISELIFNNHQNKDTVFINFSVNHTLTDIVFAIPNKELKGSTFYHFLFNYDLEKNQVTAKINESASKTFNTNLPKKLNLSFAFGPEIRGESPKIILRDIKFFKNGSLAHRWKLNEEWGTIAHDSVDDLNTLVINGKFIIRNHHYWENTDSLRIYSNGYTKVLIDSVYDRLLIFTQKKLYTYSFQNKMLDSIDILGDEIKYITYFIIDYEVNKIYGFGPGPGNIAEYDINNKRWSHKFNKIDVNGHLYDAVYFQNPIDNNYYLFSGYGWFTYKNSLYKYNGINKEWDSIKTKGDIYSPRSVAHFTKINSEGKLFISKGMGNTTGIREQGRWSFVDLYLLNMKDTSITKIWEFEKNITDFQFINDNRALCIDGDSFYQIYISDKYRQSKSFLARFSFKEPLMEIISSELIENNPGDFQYYYFRREAKSHLYFNINYQEDSSYVDIKMYKLNYPSVNKEVYSASVFKYDIDSINYSTLILSGSFVFILIGLFVFVKIKKNRSGKTFPLNNINKDVNNEYSIEYNFETWPVKLNKLNPPYVKLFGEFEIKQNEETDLAKQMSPKIKELFIIILIYSLKPISKQPGISYSRLTEYLWPDIPDYRQKNNRSVSVFKLRKILSEFPFLELVQSKNYLYFKNCNSVYSDFGELNSLIKNYSQNNNNLTESELEKFCEIINEGNFLTNINYDWLDPIKIEIHETIIEILINRCELLLQDSNYKDLLKFSNLIFKFDQLSPEAISFKCKSLKMLGKFSVAKQIYEHFCKEYLRIYGEEFKVGFNDLI